MKIPLSEFEQHLDETILKRGMKYFKGGLVQEPDELSSEEFEFMVHSPLFTKNASGILIG